MKTRFFALLLSIAASIFVVCADSGTCGENLTWDLTDSVLTISGAGTMPDYGHYTTNRAPWYSQMMSIKTIAIKDGVTTIGNYAFIGSENLLSVQIPLSITSIGSYAFYGCTRLVSAQIPNSVQSIGNNAFRDVSNIVYHGAATGSPWGAKYTNGYADGYLIYSDESKTELVACCSSLATGDLDISDSVLTISGAVFSGCKGMTSVTIGNGVTSIGNSTFMSCSNLISVTIGNGVTSIGNSAFYDCTSLKSVTIGNRVRSIGRDAFGYCSNLISVNIPDSVSSIGIEAFYWCDSLTNVIIGKSVTSIGEWAFRRCGKLATIECEAATPPNLGDEVFSMTALANIYIPCGSLNSYQNTTSWSDYNNIMKYHALPYSVQISCDTTYGKIEYSIGNTICDTVFALTALPNEGFHLTQWSDGSTESMRTIHLTQDTIITAEFSINEYSIVYNFDSILGDVKGLLQANHLDSVIIEAVPNRGCYFVQWSDSVMDNPRSFIIIQDTTFTANFDYVLSDKCGKDSALVWNLNTTNLALDVSGAGALTNIYTHGYFVKAASIGDEITVIGTDAFANCYNLKTIKFGTGLKIIEQGAFPNAASIDTITSYSQRPPTVSNGAFVTLAYSTVVYVPFEYLETYKMHDFWGVYDVRPLTKPEDISNTNISTPAQKLILDGQVFILRGEKLYTLQGQEVK